MVKAAKISGVLIALCVFGAAWVKWPAMPPPLRENAIRKYLEAPPNERLAQALRAATQYPDSWIALQQMLNRLQASAPTCVSNPKTDLAAPEYVAGLRAVRHASEPLPEKSRHMLAAIRDYEVNLVQEMTALAKALGCLGNAAIARSEVEELQVVQEGLKNVAIVASRGPLGGEVASKEAVAQDKQLVSAGNAAGLAVGNAINADDLPSLTEVLRLDRLRLLASVVESVESCDDANPPRICGFDVNMVADEINTYYDRVVRECLSCVAPPSERCRAASRVPPFNAYTRVQLLLYPPGERLRLSGRSLGRALLASASVSGRVSACRFLHAHGE